MTHAGSASLTMLPGSEQPTWPALHDLAFLLASEAGALAGRLSSGTATAVGDLVRGMNCYYSNLIEGHDTRPVDIERAMRADFATEPHRRDLQIEAAAHIAVQAAIDGGELDEFATPSALTVEIHRQFYERLPASLRFVEERETGRRVEVRPGKLRTDHVRVGRHVAPSPEDLTGWLARLDEGAPERFGRAERPVVIAALHHRLLWIHPFADGNGRTARLLSHALLRRTGVGSALWSVSRGLARHVEAYKSYLARADAPPQGALDGRGVLSDGRLADFCRFFMAASLDQVRFMRTLLYPEALSDRVREFIAAEAAGNRLDARLAPLLERAILFGEVPRAEVPSLVGTSDRQARRLVQPLLARGLLTGAKDAPLRVAFPLGETERLFPHLWVPSSVASAVAPLPEIEEALRLPQRQ
jgi:Fic family protein